MTHAWLFPVITHRCFEPRAEDIYEQVSHEVVQVQTGQGTSYWPAAAGVGMVLGGVTLMAIHPLPKEAEGSRATLCALLTEGQGFPMNLGVCGLSVGSWVNDFFALWFLFPFLGG